MSAKLFLKNNVLWMPSLYMQKQHTEVFYKRDVLKSFMKFTGIQLRQSLSLIKLQAFNCKPKTLLKKRLQHSCFPVKSNYFVDYLWMAASVLAVTLANITLRETFFALLKHECTRKAWTAAITWKKDNLSKKVFSAQIILKNFALIKTGYHKKNYSTHCITIKGDLLTG